MISFYQSTTKSRLIQHRLLHNMTTINHYSYHLPVPLCCWNRPCCCCWQNVVNNMHACMMGVGCLLDCLPTYLETISKRCILMEVEMIPCCWCWQNVNSNSSLLPYLPPTWKRYYIPTKNWHFPRRHLLEHQTGHFAIMVFKRVSMKKWLCPLL